MLYDIRVTGEWDEHVTEFFGDVRITRAGRATVLSGDLDQAALHGLLQRIRHSGLTLLDVRRRRRPLSPPPGSVAPATSPSSDEPLAKHMPDAL